MPAKRRRKPAVEAWEVRMLARVTKGEWKLARRLRKGS